MGNIFNVEYCSHIRIQKLILFSVCVSAGYYLSYWNIPIFPHSCTDDALADKSIYDTLIRVNADLGKMGKVVAYLFKTYEWKRAVVIDVEDG